MCLNDLQNDCAKSQQEEVNIKVRIDGQKIFDPAKYSYGYANAAASARMYNTSCLGHDDDDVEFNFNFYMKIPSLSQFNYFQNGDSDNEYST